MATAILLPRSEALFTTTVATFRLCSYRCKRPQQNEDHLALISPQTNNQHFLRTGSESNVARKAVKYIRPEERKSATSHTVSLLIAIWVGLTLRSRKW
jgi:hypothetical protein